MTASLLPTAVGFLMLPVYTRYLTPTEYGLIALVLSLQSFLPLIMTLQVQNSIMRFYFDYNHDDSELRIFISTILFVTALLSSSITALLIYNLSDIVSFVFPKTIIYEEIFLLGVISSFIGVFSSVFKNLIRVQQKAKLFMKVSLSLFVLSLIVNVLEVIVYERGAYGVIEASLITVVLTSIVYCFLVKEFFIFKVNLTLIWNPLKFSLPLIPHSLSGLIFLYSDRIILEKYVTLSAIGLYMLSDKIAMVFKMIVTEFNNAFSPYFNQLSIVSKEKAVEETQRVSLVFIYIISIILSILSLFSVELVYLLFDSRYYNSWYIIPILSLAYVYQSQYMFIVSGVFYEKKTHIIMYATISAGFLNILLNLYYIPLYGIMAAAYTTVISFVILSIASEVISKRIYYTGILNKKLMTINIYLIMIIILSIKINIKFYEFGVLQ